MSTWAWVGVGLGVVFLVAVLLSIAIAATLGRISREASELFESELWAQVPLAREQAEAQTKTASASEQGHRQVAGRRR
jgi:Na+-transporting methylmalonyl-CoA/oxaloacetate decarboxylase gamma subunit